MKKKLNYFYNLPVNPFILAIWISSMSVMAIPASNNNSLIIKSTIQGPITGTVTDENGAPLPGASVLEKATGNGVSTDFEGKFAITTSTKNAVLVVSFVGYTSQEVSVGNNATINVKLQPDTAELEEIVVVGYGVQKKVNLTGAVSKISAETLEDRPVTSVTNALQGTMAGVTVTAANSGQPGRDNGNIRIRGIGTLNNSNPLVLIDGVVASLNDINPDDVDSISVLKDAASSAIYGSRAANGVVLVTTKKGKKGTSQIQLQSYIGQVSPTYLPDFLPSWQAADLYNQALQNEGKPARFTPDEIQKFKNGSDPYNYPNTDWLGLYYQGNGIQQNQYVSISGGSEKTQHLFSLGLYDANGIVKKTNFKRYTFRSNINSQVSDKLGAYANIAFTGSTINEPSNPFTGDFNQITRQINRISPIIPYKYKNGHYGSIGDGNPLAWLEGDSFNKENGYDFVGSVGADWEPVKNLHVKPMLSYVLNFNKSKSFIADLQYYNAQGNPTFYQGPNSVTDENSLNAVQTNQITLDYSIALQNHNFSVLVGTSRELTKYTYDKGFRKNFLNNKLYEIDLGSTDGQVANGNAYEVALESFFGRFNYDYDNKYLLEANIRRDGSSRFSKTNRWGVFPSFSAGWNVDKEAFYEPLSNAINTMKLRASWGKLGNQNINSQYPYITTINSGLDYTFGGGIAPGVGPVNGANENIKWETTTIKGAGLDLSFLNRSLTLSVDYFDRFTSDILLSVPVGGVYGLNAPVQNAGAVSNNGWEFELAYNNKRGDFKYNAAFNTSIIENKITDLYGTGPIIEGGYGYKEVGYPINSLYGYVAEGIFQTEDEVKNHATQSTRTAPGDIKYKDLNNDGVINTEDRQYIGNTFPKITFGLNLGVEWNNFDLALFFQGATKVDTYIDLGKIGDVGAAVDKPTSAWLDSWTPNNTSAKMPRILDSYNLNDPSSKPSSFWIQDGSYIRLKNLQVGYTLPANTLKAIKVTKARIYYSGQNILTFSKLYNWIDPEAPNVSSIYYYPQVKVNTVGINLTF